MPTNEAPKSPRKRCLNCRLSCDDIFCCDWCLKTYKARLDAHQVGHRQRASSQADKDSAPGAAQVAARDEIRKWWVRPTLLPRNAD